MKRFALIGIGTLGAVLCMAAPQEVLHAPSGILTKDPGSADGAIVSRINDGNLLTEWRSPYNTYRNDLEYKFDPTLSGASGFDGNNSNLFTLNSVNLYNWVAPYGVNGFQIFVKTDSCGAWSPVDAPASNALFNFALDANGGTVTKDPGAADGTNIGRLTDGSTATEWRSPYNTYRNDIEYKFDPTLSGQSGLDGNDANLFTLNNINLYNWASPYGLRDFQLFVKTKTAGVISNWTLVSPQVVVNNAFNFLLDANGGTLTKDPGAADGTTAARLTDGTTNTEWRSPYNTYRNDLEYKFDPTLSGTSGLDGNDANLFTFNKLNLYNWVSPYGLKDFQLFVKTKTSGVLSAWTPVVASTNTISNFNFLLDVNGATLTKDPGAADGTSAARLTDGSTSTEWRSPYNTYLNDLEYKFDPTLSGTAGLDGNDANLVTLSRFNLYSYASPYSVKDFQIFVKTKTAGVLSGWLPVNAPAATNPAFNFLATANGSTLTKDPGSADGEIAAHLTDNTITGTNAEWRSPYNTLVNDLEYKFDPTLSGTSGLDGNDANLFTLDRVVLYNWASPYSVKTFQIFVQTKTGGLVSAWTPVSIGGSTTATATTAAGAQTFLFDAAISNVVALRMRTLTNYGGNRTIIYELQAPGTWAGRQTIFTANSGTGLQTFTPDTPVANVAALRFRTLSNYGADRTIIYELEWPGSFTGTQTVFTASSATGQQSFAPAAPIANVAALRLRTLSNYGGDRTIIYEMEAPGSWSGVPATFTAASATGLQTFYPAAPVANVAALRLRTLSNYGGDRTIVYEMEAQGPWSGRRTVFNAASGTGLQTFTPASAVPNVSALRLRTLSNYGGDRTIIYEAKVNGTVGPVGLAGSSCSWPVSPTPASFNCVEPLATPSTGHLNTKLAGTPFAFDVVALNADGTLMTSYASTSSKIVNVELVDGSGSTACSVRAALSPAVNQNLTFTAADAGRKSILAMPVANAYPDLRCRVTDANQAPSIVSCSSDDFAVRPVSLTVASSASADASGSSASATPTVKAGANFVVTASGGSNYSGTPKLDTSKLGAHGGAIQTGTLSGSFAAANAQGLASANLTYSEVGYFNLAANGVYDDTFTAVDAAAGDCVAGFSSSGGKLGCSFGNTTSTAYMGRFVPDHLSISPGQLINRADINTGNVAVCNSGFTYMGEDFKTTFSINALNSANALTKNYTGAYANFNTNVWSNFNFSASGASLQQGVLATSGSWGASSGNYGIASVTAVHKVARPASATLPYANLTVKAQPSYTDGGQTIGAAAATALHAGTTELRYGDMAMRNVYGSELLDLQMPVTMKYWTAAGAYSVNTDDSCTVLPPDSVGWVFLPVSPNLTACRTQLASGTSTSFTAGTAMLRLTKPGAGHSGTVVLNANINGSASGVACLGTTPTAVVPGSLPWLGAGTPSARATFGLFKSPLVYRREDY